MSNNSLNHRNRRKFLKKTFQENEKTDKQWLSRIHNMVSNGLQIHRLNQLEAEKKIENDVNLILDNNLKSLIEAYGEEEGRKIFEKNLKILEKDRLKKEKKRLKDKNFR